jgi:hypothetical protein
MAKWVGSWTGKTMASSRPHKPLVVGSNPTLATINPYLGVFCIYLDKEVDAYLHR